MINSAVNLQCSLMGGAIERHTQLYNRVEWTHSITPSSKDHCKFTAELIIKVEKIIKTKRHGNERFCTITTYVWIYQLSINLFPNGFISSVVFLVSIRCTGITVYIQSPVFKLRILTWTNNKENLFTFVGY